MSGTRGKMVIVFEEFGSELPAKAKIEANGLYGFFGGFFVW